LLKPFLYLKQQKQYSKLIIDNLKWLLFWTFVVYFIHN
jgi:hypothetical protein